MIQFIRNRYLPNQISINNVPRMRLRLPNGKPRATAVLCFFFPKPLFSRGMYTENQAIQKKRDNVQTSALEWIIAHLKALQSNIVNINTWVQQQQPKYYEFQVTFPTYWSEVGPADFAITSNQTGLDTYRATYSAALSDTSNTETTITYYPYATLKNVVPEGNSSEIANYRQMVTDIFTLSQQYNVFGFSAAYKNASGVPVIMHAVKLYQYTQVPPSGATTNWMSYMHFAIDLNKNSRADIELLGLDYTSQPAFPTKTCIQMYTTSTTGAKEFLTYAAGNIVTLRLYYNENRAFDMAVPGNV